MGTPVIARDYDLSRVRRGLLDDLVLTPGAALPVATYRPVLALSVTRGAAREVLAVVRDAHENRTHPNVVSSPTRRIHGHDSDVADLGRRVGPDAPRVDVPDWLQHEVRRLLVEKVGVAESDVAGLCGDAVQVWQAHSVIATEGDQVVSEPLTMVNVHVDLPAGVAVPVRTADHSSQLFLPRRVHRKAFEDRDPSALVGAGLSGPMPIVYGLCTKSTSSMLDALGHLE